ncbi:MAG: putative 2-aminoethylphosphonate ABC transporter permease subunit, partial [Rhodospirillales bacterium]|nr:putative 2-aminoethylphosphonate ABC transporter permease subunit [Rhodospirillales bacterium]
MANGLSALALKSPAIRPKVSSDDWIMRAGMGAIGVFLLIAVVLPLYWILSKSFQDKDGLFIGFANYIEYFSTPALFNSIYNSLFISLISMTITVTLAFWYAYALT